MTRNARHLIRLVSLVVFSIGLSYAADVPQVINFQGRLTDTSNNPTSGNIDFVFKFYSDLSGGTQLPAASPWSESQTLTVTNGVFNASIGSGTPIPFSVFDSTSVYLQIEVEGEALTPRETLLSAPFSFNTHMLSGRTYDAFIDTFTAQSIDGLKTFSTFPRKSGSLTPTVDSELTTKEYVDGLIAGDGLLNSTNTWTADQTFQNPVTMISSLTVTNAGGLNVIYGIVAGSVTANDLSASQFVKTDGNKKLVSATIAGGDLPANVVYTDTDQNITGNKTFASSITVTHAGGMSATYGVVAGSLTLLANAPLSINGSAGSSGEVLQSNGAGSAPTWVPAASASALLSTTNTWTANQIMTSSGGLNVTYGVVAGSFTGLGTNLTSLTGANIVTGIPSAVLPSTVAYVDKNQLWSAPQTYGSSITVTSAGGAAVTYGVTAGTLTLTANAPLSINGSVGSSGQVLQSGGASAAPTWVDPAQASALLSTTNTWTANQIVTSSGGLNVTYGVVAGSFTGLGSGLTGLTGANIASGIASAVLPSTVAYVDKNQLWSAPQTYGSSITVANAALFGASGQAVSISSNAYLAMLGGLVGIGTANPQALLDITGDGGSILVPRKSDAGDPAVGVNGMIYYNASGAKFRGYQNGAWSDLITNAATDVILIRETLQAGATFYVSSGTVLDLNIQNTLKLAGASGSSGQVLQSNGAGSVPTWVDPASASTLLATTNTWTANQIMTSSGGLNVTYGVVAGSFTGVGSGLTALTPANISAGTAGIDITGNAATASYATSAGSAGSLAGGATTFILLSDSLQSGATFFVSSGTVQALRVGSSIALPAQSVALAALANGTLPNTVVASSITPLSVYPAAVQSSIYPNITGVGAQSQSLSMNSHQINNLLDPTGPYDAATKVYVDVLVYGNTNYIHVKESLQPGSTFYVSSGTVLDLNIQNTLKLAGASGSSGQVLQSNGAGSVPTWVDPASASALLNSTNTWTAWQTFQNDVTVSTNLIVNAGSVRLNPLTASQFVKTDADKKLVSATIASGDLPANVVYTDTNQTISGVKTLTSSLTVTSAGGVGVTYGVAAGSFTGLGTGLTNLTGANIVTGIASTVLPSTVAYVDKNQLWSAPQTYGSSVTVTSIGGAAVSYGVTAGTLTLTANAPLSINGSVGSSGQILQSGGASAAPTWVDPASASALLNSTNTWTATQMYVSSIAVSAPGGIGLTYGLVAGSVTTTGDVNVKGLSYNWPAAHTVGVLSNNGAGGLTWAPAGAGEYILNTNTLQAGSTAYPDFLYVGSSATVLGPGGLRAIYGVVAGSLTLNGELVAGGSAGSSGYTLQSNGPGAAPTWVAVPGASSLLSSTNTWTAGQTFVSSVTFSSMVVAGNGVGSSGQVLQSNGPGAVPTWVNPGSADVLLASTNTWTAWQTFQNDVTVSTNLIVNAGSLQLNPLTASQFVKTDSSKKLVSATIASGDLPANVVYTDTNQTISGVKTLTSSLTVTSAGGVGVTYGVAAGSFTGLGSGLTGLTGSSIASGIPSTVLPSTVAYVDKNQLWSAPQTYGSSVTVANAALFGASGQAVSISSNAYLAMLGGLVGIGTANPQALLDITGDGGSILVPRKSDAGDPAVGVNGMIYYNASGAKFRGYQNGAWSDLITNAATDVILIRETLQAGATFYVSSGTVLDLNIQNTLKLAGASGSSGQVLQSNGAGSVPTWVDPAQASALLASTNTWTANQIMTSSGGLNVTYGVVAGSVTANDLSASQFVKTDADKKLVSATIASGDLPANVVYTDTNQTISGVKTLTSSLTVTSAGGVGVTYGVAAGSFTGLGTGLTNLTGANIVTGIASTVLPSTVAYVDKNQLWSAPQTYGSSITVANAALFGASGQAVSISSNAYLAMLGGLVGIGTANPQALLDITGDGGSILVPRKSDAGDPAVGVNGMIYYNASGAKFRGYQNGAWSDLITNAATDVILIRETLQAGATFYVSSGTVLDLNIQNTLKLAGASGSSGQVLQSNGAGSVPTWVDPASASALLNSTNTWTATQMYVSSIAVSAPGGIGLTYGLVAGSVTTTGDVNVKGLSYNWPAAHTVGVLSNNGAGGLTWAPAGAGEYILNTNTLQAGSTAYPDFLYVGSSATVLGPGGLRAIYGVVAGSLTLNGELVAGGSAGSSGYTLQSNGPGAAPTWVAVPGASSLLSSTNTWTAGQTFVSSVTFSSMVVAGNGVGSSGQVLQSNGPGAVPTWVNPGSADVLLASTNTWTAWQTFQNDVTVSTNLIVNAGSLQLNPLTASQFVKTDSSKKLVSATIASGDLPANVVYTDTNQTISGVKTLTSSLTVTSAGGVGVTYGVAAGSFTGLGTGLTNLTGANIVTGIASTVLPSTVAYVDKNQLWSAPQTYGSSVTVANAALFGASGQAVSISSNAYLAMLGGLVGIGTANPQALLDITGDGGSILVPRKSDAGDPAVGVNGMIYYNASGAKFRGYQNGAWSDLITNAATDVILIRETLQAGATFYVSSGTVLDLNIQNTLKLAGASGSSGQVLQSNGAGSVPTWVDPAQASALLASTNTWTANQIMTSSGGLNVTYGVVAGSVTANDLSASQFVKTDGNKKLVSATIASGDLPANVVYTDTNQTISGVKTLTSSLTVTSAGGVGVTYGVAAGSFTGLGTGLTNLTGANIVTGIASTVLPSTVAYVDKNQLWSAPQTYGSSVTVTSIGGAAVSYGVTAGTLTLTANAPLSINGSVGSSGQILQSGGASAAPTWVDPASASALLNSTNTWTAWQTFQNDVTVSTNLIVNAGSVRLNPLTASQFVKTDADKKLVSATIASGDLPANVVYTDTNQTISGVKTLTSSLTVTSAGGVGVTYGVAAGSFTGLGTGLTNLTGANIVTGIASTVLPSTVAYLSSTNTWTGGQTIASPSGVSVTYGVVAGSVTANDLSASQFVKTDGNKKLVSATIASGDLPANVVYTDTNQTISGVKTLTSSLTVTSAGGVGVTYGVAAGSFTGLGTGLTNLTGANIVTGIASTVLPSTVAYVDKNQLWSAPQTYGSSVTVTSIGGAAVSYGVTAGTLTLTANAPLSINGSVGSSGQILQSGGASAAPTWVDPASASALLNSTNTWTAWQTFQNDVTVSTNLIVNAGSLQLNPLTASQFVKTDSSKKLVSATIASGDLPANVVYTDTNQTISGVKTLTSSLTVTSAGGVGVTYGVAAGSFTGLGTGLTNLTGANIVTGIASTVLPSTVAYVDKNQLWSAPQTYGSSVTVTNAALLGASGQAVTISSNLVVSGAVLASNNSGTSGQVLQSQGPGAAPTWVSPASASALLNSTNTWTAWQTFQNDVTVSTNLIVNAGSLQLNPLTASQFVKTDSSKKLVSATIASGDLPANVVYTDTNQTISGVKTLTSSLTVTSAGGVGVTYGVAAGSFTGLGTGLTNLTGANIVTGIASTVLPSTVAYVDKNQLWSAPQTYGSSITVANAALFGASGQAVSISSNAYLAMLGGLVGIGTANPQALLDITGDGGSILVPRKSDAGDPAVGVNGMIYYNASGAKFRGYQNGAWSDLITNAATDVILIRETLQAGATFYVSSGTVLDLNIQNTLKLAGASGSSGQVLQSNGAGSVPTWVDPASASALLNSTNTWTAWQTFQNDVTVSTNLIVNAGSLQLNPLTASQFVKTDSSKKLVSATIASGDLPANVVYTDTNQTISGVKTLTSSLTVTSAGGVGVTYGVAAGSFTGLGTGLTNLTGANIVTGIASTVLPSTVAYVDKNQLWSAPQTYGSSITVANAALFGASGQAVTISSNLVVSGAVLASNNSGTSGQVLQSQGPGAAPTWVSPASASALLNSTNTWTAWQTFQNDVTVSTNLIVNAGSLQLNPLTASQFVKTDSSKKLVSATIASGDLPANVVYTDTNQTISGVKTLTSSLTVTSAGGVGVTYGVAAGSFTGLGTGLTNLTGANIVTGIASTVLPSTVAYVDKNQLWSAPQTYGSSVTVTNAALLGASGQAVTISSNLVVSGAVLASNNSGTSGQVLQSQGPGAAPTWVSPASASALLNSTNTWTAWQTFQNDVTVSTNLIVNAGSLQLNPLTASQFVKTDSSKKLVSATIASGDLPANVVYTDTNQTISGVKTLTSSLTVTSAGGVGVTYGVAAGSFTGLGTGLTNLTGANIVTGIASTVLPSTVAYVDKNQLWSAPQTYGSSITVANAALFGASGQAVTISSNLVVSGAVLASNNSGTSGQVLQSQGPGAAPTWVSPASASALLNSTNTWTAWQTFQNDVTVSTNLIVNAGSLQLNPLTASQFVKTDSSKKLVSATIASGDLPANVVYTDTNQTISGVKTLTSSLTVTSAGGVGVTYGVAAGSFTGLGTGLTNLTGANIVTGIASTVLPSTVAYLSSTNTWTGGQTIASPSGVSVTYGVVAGSVTANDLSASQFVKTDGNKKLVSATIASGDLPANVVYTDTNQTISGVKTLTSSLTVTSAGGVGVTYGVVAGSVTANDLSASQFVKTDGSKKLVSAGLVAGDLPGGATSYIQLTQSLQTGSTFYVSSGTVQTQLALNGALVLSGSAGTASQVLQSNGPGAAPTWGAGATGLLSSTNTWTAGQTYVSSVTFSSMVVVNNASLAITNGQFGSTINQKGSTGSGSVEIDWSNGNTQHVVLTGNPTLTFANGISGRKYVLMVKQDATGGRNINWPGTIRFPGGAYPVLSSAGNKTDYMAFIFNDVDSTYDNLAYTLNY